MQIQFDAPDFGNTTHYVIRWFDAANVLVKEQTQSTFNAVPVAGTPGRYVFGTNAIEKPSPAPSGPLTIKLASKNAAGIGAESAPTAPFSIAPPAAPTNVVVIDPAL